MLDFPAERGWARALRLRAPRRGPRARSGTPYGWRPGTAERPDGPPRSSSPTAASTGRSRRSSGRCSPTRATPRAGRFQAFSAVAGHGHARRPERPDGRDADRDDERLRHGGGRVRDSRRAARSAPGASRPRSGGGGASSASRSTSGRPSRSTLKDPAEAAAAQPARRALTGEARYYFGLPVASGTVRWRVTRTPSYPWWFWWRGCRARGRATRDDRGRATPPSRPTARSRSRSRRRPTSGSRRRRARSTYSLRASPPTPRTRAARRARPSRAFRLGFVAVEARVELPGRLPARGDGGRGHGRPDEPRRRAARRARAPGGSSASSSRREAPLPAEPSARTRRPSRRRASLRDAGRRSAPALADGLRAGAVAAQLEGRRRGRARRPDARREGRGADRASRTFPPAPTGCATRRATSSAPTYEMPQDFVVAGREDAARAAGRPARRERPRSPSAGRRASSSASGLPGQTLLPRGRPRRDGRSSGATLIAGKSPARHRDPGRGEGPRRLRRHADGSARPPARHADADRLRAVGRQGAEGQLRDVPRPAAARDSARRGRSRSRRRTGAPLEPAAAELLAYMYDRSLDVFAPAPPAEPAVPLSRIARRSPGRAPSLGEADFQ